MKTSWKRMLSLLLVAAMVLSFGAAGYAAELDEDIVVVDPEEAADVQLVDDIQTAAEGKVWVGGVEITEDNASDVLGDGEVSYDFETNTLSFTGTPSSTAPHDGAVIDAVGMDLTIVFPESGLVVDWGEVTAGIRVTGGTLTVNGNLDITVEGDEVTAIYAEKGLTVNGDLAVSASNYMPNGGENYGIKCDDGSLIVNGDSNIIADRVCILCSNGDVALNGNVFVRPNSSTTNSGGIRAENGSVAITGSFYFDNKATAAIYADGDITIGDTVTIGNKNYKPGRGLYSENGKIVCEKDVTIFANNFVICSVNGEEGILIKGETTLTSPSSSAANLSALKAGNGPITVNGNLTMSCGGDPSVYALKDITFGGDAYIAVQTYNTRTHINKAVVSEEGSISAAGKLTTYSSNSAVYAYKNITVGGDTLLSFARGNDSTTVDYGLKAETGLIRVAGKLDVLGKALFSASAGADITVNANVTIENAEETSVGILAGGKISFVGGKWDVSAGTAALRAKEGIEIPEGFCVTTPVCGTVSKVGDYDTVTELDESTVAAHAVIEAGVHEWNEPTYTWSEDNSSVTATVVCKTNPEHKLTETVTATYAVITEPTATSEGLGRWTATFTRDPFTTQTKDVVIEKLSEDGFAIEIKDYTKGAASCSIDTGALYEGKVVFTVEANRAVLVAVENGEEDYTVLACSTDETGKHSFTVKVTKDTVIALAFKGDADLDGTVKTTDGTMIKRAAMNTYTLAGKLNELVSDVNGDGEIKATEGTMVSRAAMNTYELPW